MPEPVVEPGVDVPVAPAVPELPLVPGASVVPLGGVPAPELSGMVVPPELLPGLVDAPDASLGLVLGEVAPEPEVP